MLLCVPEQQAHILMEKYFIELRDDCVAGWVAWFWTIAGYPLLSDAANNKERLLEHMLLSV
jgi:hypothetical protein